MNHPVYPWMMNPTNSGWGMQHYTGGLLPPYNYTQQQ
jgi:hypothetical protein